MRSVRRARRRTGRLFAALSVAWRRRGVDDADCHADCQAIGAALDAPPRNRPASAPTNATASPPVRAPPRWRSCRRRVAPAINPAAPVLLRAHAGTITDVVMANDAGTAIPGALTPDHRVWKLTGQLGYGREIHHDMTARGPQGMPSRQTSQLHHPRGGQPGQGLFGNRGQSASRRRHLRRRRDRRRQVRRAHRRPGQRRTAPQR